MELRAILLPGGVMPADLAYGALLEALGDDVQAIAKDLEVYAGPEPPPDYTLEYEIEGVLRTAEKAGFDRFHLVGYSGGGASSLAFAASHPERLLSLALLEPAWLGNEGLVWHINEGNFGDVKLDGLNFAAIGHFVGNIWEEGTKADMGFFIDERADESQREALQTIFGGQAGGWPAAFADTLGNLLGIEVAQIEVEIADDLANWRAEIPGKFKAAADVLEGPTSVPGKRTQVHDPPGSEVGPGSVATYGTATADEVDAFGFKWDWAGRSSKHMGFEWSGPD